MKVSYSKFFNKLKEYGLTQKEFKDRSGISSGTMGNLINNKSITVNSICCICDFFHCMPDEIMEWIPDSDYPAELLEKQQAREEVKAQIAELQAKLKQM